MHLQQVEWWLLGGATARKNCCAVVSFKSSFFVVQAYRRGIMEKSISGKVKEYKSEDGSECTQTLKGESHCMPARATETHQAGKIREVGDGTGRGKAGCMFEARSVWMTEWR